MAIPYPERHFKFDGDVVDSAYGENGSLVGGVFVPGRTGQALSLDNNEYVDISYTSNTGYMREAFTSVGWYKFRSVSERQPLFSKREPGNAQNTDIVLEWLDSTSELRFRTFGLTTLDQAVPLTPTLGEWYFIGVVYDKASSETRIYINNTESVFTNSGDLNATTLYGRIGNDGFSFYSKVDFDEVQFFKEALTAEQIGEIYNPPNPSTGTRNIWAGDNVDANQGTSMGTGVDSVSVVDDKLIGTIGTPVGNFNWWEVVQGPPPVVIPYANIRYEMDQWPPVSSEGSALPALTVNQGSTPPPVISNTPPLISGNYLDWSGCLPNSAFNGYIWRTDADSSSNFDVTDITFSIWYKIPTGYTDGGSLLLQDFQTGERKHRGIIAGGSPLRFRGRDSTGQHYDLLGAEIYDQWVHAVFQQVGNEITCWQNGNKIGVITISGDPTVSWRSWVHSGNSYRTYGSPLMEAQYTGLMDDVRIWKQNPLTDEQITALYQQGIST